MAILTRRALQGLIDELPLPSIAIDKLVHRLNEPDSFAAEWELIILSALSKVGAVEHEPKLGGPANLDFRFTSKSCSTVVGDITAISDDEANRLNPISVLEGELYRRTYSLSLPGSFVANPSYEYLNGHKVRLKLPASHRFTPSIFNSTFDAFLEVVKAASDHSHSVLIQNDEASLTIVYSPAKTVARILSYPSFRIARNVVHNPIYNRLKKKADQLKRAGRLVEGVAKGIVICDGGSELLQDVPGIDVIGFRTIARHFLRKRDSFDFVAVVRVREPSSSYGGIPSFEVILVESSSALEPQEFSDLLQRGLREIPKPFNTPINARRESIWHPSKGASTLNYFERAPTTYSAENQLTLSARTVVDFLTDRITRERFQILCGDFALDALKRAINDGALVSSIELTKRLEYDDDEIVLRWGFEDPSVSCFVRRRG